MCNPLNDNDYIRKSKDGTEVEATVGKELCLMFNINYKPENGEVNLPKLGGKDMYQLPLQIRALVSSLQTTAMNPELLKHENFSKTY